MTFELLALHPVLVNRILTDCVWFQLQSKLSRLQVEDKKLQGDITREEVKKGQLEKEMEQQQKRIDSRNKLLSRLTGDLEICE